MLYWLILLFDHLFLCVFHRLSYDLGWFLRQSLIGHLFRQMRLNDLLRIGQPRGLSEAFVHSTVVDLLFHQSLELSLPFGDEDWITLAFDGLIIFELIGDFSSE